MSEMKMAMMKNRLEGKIEHLEKQMSSNKDLWEALTMEQGRQRTGAVELDVAKKISMTNERAVDRLKEQLNRNQRDKMVLEQVSITR